MRLDNNGDLQPSESGMNKLEFAAFLVIALGFAFFGTLWLSRADAVPCVAFRAPPAAIPAGAQRHPARLVEGVPVYVTRSY